MHDSQYSIKIILLEGFTEVSPQPEANKALVASDQVFYTGHSSGVNNFRFINRSMGKKIQTMNPGEVIEA